MTIGCPEFRHLHRRDFLQVGGVSLFGLSWASLFAARAHAAAGARPRARQMLIVWLNGGPPHHDMFDMKPDAPAPIPGPWKPIQTNLPGLQICELMGPLARVADKFTILRSVNPKGYPLKGQHGILAARPFLTGNRRNLRATPRYPLYGSVMARMRPGPGDLPAYGVLGSNRSHDSYLGVAYEPMEIKIEEPNDKLAQMLAPPPAQLNLTDLERRTALLKHMDQQLRQLDEAEPLIAGVDGFQQRAIDLLRSPKLREALDLSREPAKSAERYSKDRECWRVLAARRLIEAGVPCVFVDFRGWDFHAGSGTFERAKRNITDLGRVLAALLEDLDERGLLDSTIVISGGEMGRTPKPENNNGYSRGHWNDAQSSLVAGGGFCHRCIVGATDTIGADVTAKHYTATSFARTVYYLLGIDPDHELQQPDGRPLKIVVEDAPLTREIIA